MGARNNQPSLSGRGSPHHRLACPPFWTVWAVIGGRRKREAGFARERSSDEPEARPDNNKVGGMDHDFCNSDGARRLKQRIEEYWRERGYSVEVKLVEAGFVPAMRSARTDVRSDMVNGFPTKTASNDRNAGNPSRRGLMGVA